MSTSTSVRSKCAAWERVGDYEPPDEAVHVHIRELPAMACMMGDRSPADLVGVGGVYEQLQAEGTLKRLPRFPRIMRARVVVPLMGVTGGPGMGTRELACLRAMGAMTGELLPPASPARMLPPTAMVPLSKGLLDPGQKTLRASVYVPANLDSRQCSVLVVVLHGCFQQAEEYAEAAGWTQLADRLGFMVLAPQQTYARHPWLAFNWYEPDGKGKGEAAAILDMVRLLKKQYSSLKRIFITGLSAGGAMTVVLLADSTEFEGGAIIAGLPYRCAGGLAEAMQCMRKAKNLGPEEWRDRVQPPGSPPRERWPRVSIWHGMNDWTVDPVNAYELAEQWTSVQGIDQQPVLEEQVKGHLHRVYAGKDGRAAVETYLVQNMPHGTPVDPGKEPDQGGDSAACPWLYDADIFSSYHIAKFWGILA